MIQPPFGEEIDDTAAGARLGVARTIDQATDARMHDGAGAHRAGLQRDVKVAVRKTVVAERAGRITQRCDLGVCRGIISSDRSVAAAANDYTVAHDDGAYGHLAAILSESRECQRFTDPAFALLAFAFLACARRVRCCQRTQRRRLDLGPVHASSAQVALRLGRNDRLDFDLDHHVGVDKASDFHHRGRRPDRSERFAVGASHGLPLRDVGDEYSCADHRGQARPG